MIPDKCIAIKDFLDRIGHSLNIYHTQYYTDELTDTIFFVTQQKYAGVNTSSNSIYYLFMTFRVLASKQSKQARDDPIAMFLLHIYILFREMIIVVRKRSPSGSRLASSASKWALWGLSHNVVYHNVEKFTDAQGRTILHQIISSECWMSYEMINI